MNRETCPTDWVSRSEDTLTDLGDVLLHQILGKGLWRRQDGEEVVGALADAHR